MKINQTSPSSLKLNTPRNHRFALRPAGAMLAALTLLCLGTLTGRAQTTIYSDDFNRASLGSTYTISQGGGNGTGFIVGSTTLWLTNGPVAGRVSVATNIPSGNGFSPTLDSCGGLVTWTFNMRFGRTGGLPSGFTANTYGVGYILTADSADFSTNSKGYAILYGNSGTTDTFRLVAFTNGIRADFTTAGSGAGNALIVGTGAFATTTQAQANDYYSFRVTYDKATQIWTFEGRDDGAAAFADPATGSFTSLGTFTETTPIFRATALGQTGAFWNHSTGANNPSQFDNFKLTVVQPNVVAINNAGTPTAANIVLGSTDLPLFGFQLIPSASMNFTALKLTTAGTATASDLSNFRVLYDADNSGTFTGGDTVVSGAAASLANPINFTITGQTAFNTARRYLVFADVAGGATVGRTFTGSIAVAADVTATIPATGSAAGNQQTIIAAPFDLTTTAVVSSESATISSLLNDATIPTTSQGAQVWQVTVSNPAGNAGAATISAMTFTQGANNGVANWLTSVQAAELFDGATALAAGTMSATSIAFSGLSVSVADNASKTLSLRLSLKSTAGALKDNAHFQFALNNGDVTATGNGVTTTLITSDQAQNQIIVLATKLAFTSVPTSVITNTPFSATVLAEDANGNVDLDDTTTIVITTATGSGTLTGGVSYVAAGGTNRWSSLSYDTVGTFSLQAAGGVLASAISANINALALPTLAEVYVPQFMQGIASGSTNTKRLPYACRVTISNLTPNATYRYYNQCVVSTDAATSTGAGNCIFALPAGSFIRTIGPSLSTAGNYAEFTTDGTGNYTGWFISEPTGNTRFTAGNQVFVRIVLNDGANGTFTLARVTTTTPATVLAFNTTGANTGTGIWGDSSATAKNFVLLYDNTAGTGQPLAATLVENDGLAENTSTFFVKYYNDFVDGTNGAWGTIIPNVLANGVRRIEQRALSDGSLLAFSTDADGVWPSGANTVNPAGGDVTPIVISATDALLSAAPPATPVITAIQISGGNVLIDFTGGAADVIGDFSAVSAASLTVPFTPVAATITTSGPGVFRATIAVTVPTSFYRIKR